MTQMYKIMLLALCLIFALYNAPVADYENYCHDDKSWAEWDRIIERNPNDMEVQALHALRIGLCAKVDRG